ncbi:hypothetical protein BH23PLA1_BH23PLA1_30680 [soil metagenome]
MSTTTIPIRITPEADAFATARGFWRELDAMIERTRQVIPDLTAVSVALEERGERDAPTPLLLISAEVRSDRAFEDRSEWDWGRWAVETFPPEIMERVCMLATYGEDVDGR